MSKMEVIQADITSLRVDAIVNAANSSLRGGGGVDGAIHRVGGPAILQECLKVISIQGECRTGEAVITGGGRLPSKYVIHTVGPIWSPEQDQSELLAACYTNSLSLARQYQCKTIAFPNISTGLYRYPKQDAAKIAIESISGYIGQNDIFDRIIFCCFDAENYAIYQQELSSRT